MCRLLVQEIWFLFVVLHPLFSHASSDIDETISYDGVNLKEKNVLFLAGSKDSHIVIAITSIQHPSHKVSCSNKTTAEALFHSQAFYYGHELLKRITREEMGMLIIDSCQSPLLSLNTLSQVFSQNPSRLIDSGGQEHLVGWSQFSVVITDQPSSSVSAIYPYLNQLNIPIISTKSRSSWLFDTNRYPLLLNMQSSNNYETKTILELAQLENIKALAVVHTLNNYGLSAKSSFLEQAKSYNICIEQVLELKDSSESIVEMGKWLGTNSSLPRVFVLLMDSQSAEQLFHQIHLSDVLWSKRGKIIIGSSAISDLSIRGSFNRYGEVFLGSLILSSNRDSASDTLITTLKVFWNSENFTSGTTNPYLSRLLSNSSFCHFEKNTLSLCPTPCSTPCSASVKLTVGSDFKDVVTAYMAVAYSIADSKYHSDGNKEDIFSSGTANVAAFWKRLPKIAIPLFTDSTKRVMTPFRFQPAAYNVWNIAKGDTTALVNVLKFSYKDSANDSEIQRYRDIQYYIHGRVDKSLTFSCSTKECHCLVRFNSQKHTMPSSYPASNWDVIGIVFISLFAVVTTLIVVCILVSCRNHRHSKKGYGGNYFSLHRSSKKVYHPIPIMQRAGSNVLAIDDSETLQEGTIGHMREPMPIPSETTSRERRPSIARQSGSVHDLKHAAISDKPPEVPKRKTQRSNYTKFQTLNESNIKHQIA